MKISRGIGKCCQYRVTVAGCVADAPTMTGAEFEGVCPFSDKEISESCKACGPKGTKIAQCAKVKIFLDDIELNCKCNLPADPHEYDTLENRITDVQFLCGVKEGLDPTAKPSWTHGYFGWEEVTCQVEPEGYGYQWFDTSHRFRSAGGEGGFRYYGGPKVTGKYKNVYQGAGKGYQNDGVFGGIKCDESYCAVNMCMIRTRSDWHANSTFINNLVYITVLIPITHKKTHDALLTVLSKLAEQNRCDMVGKGCHAEEGEQENCGCGQGTCEDTVAALVEGDKGGESGGKEKGGDDTKDIVPISQKDIDALDKKADKTSGKIATKDKEVKSLKSKIAEDKKKSTDSKTAAAKANANKRVVANTEKLKKAEAKLADLSDQLKSEEEQIESLKDRLANAETALTAV